MGSDLPIVRQGSWVVAIPSLVILTAAIGLGLYWGGIHGMVIACLVYLVYSQLSRRIITREHRTGIRLMRQDRIAEAIGHFERSYELFDKHRWLDHWRGVVLLSSSRASYRELALLNVAFCHGQLGDGQQTIATYERCLELFPESGMAKSALRMLNAVRQQA